MIFSDRSIREAIESGLIQIDPYEPLYVQPSSVDLRVGDGFRVFVNHRYSLIDPRDPQSDLTRLVEVGDEAPFMLHPGEFVLGSTLERVKLGNDVVARLEGKSSLGRLGLLIHSTAGFIDPGFEGHITLELSNVATLPIAIYPGMKIGQVSFYQMTTEADLPLRVARARLQVSGSDRANSEQVPQGLRNLILRELTRLRIVRNGSGSARPRGLGVYRIGFRSLKALIESPL